MGAVSLLEKMGLDPNFTVSNLTPGQQRELAELVSAMSEQQNNSTLSITEPTEPDESEDEPDKDKIAN